MLEKLYFPHDISTFGPAIDSIFLLIFWITMVTWVLVTIILLVKRERRIRLLLSIVVAILKGLYAGYRDDISELPTALS